MCLTNCTVSLSRYTRERAFDSGLTDNNWNGEIREIVTMDNEGRWGKMENQAIVIPLLSKSFFVCFVWI